jgi:hypothetical protein
MYMQVTHVWQVLTSRDSMHLYLPRLLLLLALIAATGLHLAASFLQVLVLEAQRLNLNLNTHAADH